MRVVVNCRQRAKPNAILEAVATVALLSHRPTDVLAFIYVYHKNLSVRVYDPAGTVGTFGIYA